MSNFVKLVSRAGLVAEIPQADFDSLSLTIGPVRARERILSDAGRALKHRRELAEHYAQNLTEADQSLIRSVARQMMRDSAIHVAACELGYGNYVSRVAAGRMVNPEQWARIVSRATERAGNIDETPDDSALCCAAEALGFSTERTAEYNRYWLRPTWKITAPDGWNGQSATLAVAVA